VIRWFSGPAAFHCNLGRSLRATPCGTIRAVWRRPFQKPSSLSAIAAGRAGCRVLSERVTFQTDDAVCKVAGETSSVQTRNE
jgi:hypothetical protein